MSCPDYDDPQFAQNIVDTLWSEYDYLRKDFWNRLKTLSRFSYYMFMADYESAKRLIAEVSNPLEEHGSYFFSFTEGLTEHIKYGYPAYQSYTARQDPKVLAHSVFNRGQYPNYAQTPSDHYVRPQYHDTYTHYKGGEYSILCTAVEENTLIPLVIYESIETGLVQGRTLEDWTSEITLPDGKKVPRFQKLSESESSGS